MWSVTAEGKKFVYEDMNMDAVCLKDIAHALSYQCRYNGHCHLFYSTAEHSLNIASYILTKNENAKGAVKKKAQIQFKQALLHDAAEAYVGDMPSPFKALMPDYDKYEKALMSKIFTKYGLPAKLSPVIKELDLRICLNEKNTLFPKSHPRWEIEDTIKPLEGVTILALTPMDVYKLYLSVLQAVFPGEE